MRKLMMLLVVLGFVFAFSSAMADEEERNENAAPKGDVAVCHFPGHVDDFVINGRGCNCLDNGGEIIIMSINGCLNGHIGSEPYDSPYTSADQPCEYGVDSRLNPASCEV